MPDSLVDRASAPHIPVFDTSGRNDGTGAGADFERNAANIQCVCPNARTLLPERRRAQDKP